MRTEVVWFNFAPDRVHWASYAGRNFTDRQRIKRNSPLKKASLTGFHATAKHIAAKAVSPSSETMRTI